MAYTTTDLLSSIERKSFSPANQATFSTTDILAMADEILKGDVIPAIMATKEEFFVTYKDYSITANQSSYDLPARALTIREVQILDNDYNIISNPARINIEKVSTSSTGISDAFYLRDNQLVLYKTPTTTQNILRVYYFIDLGQLVTLASSAIISSINTGTNTISVSTIPSTWVTGNSFDFLRKSGNHEYVGNDYTSTTVSGTDITFSSLPSNLAVGDYVNLAGESSLIQLPPNFRPALTSLTAAEILMSQNQPGGDDMYKRGIDLLKKAQSFISPRVQGELEIIKPEWY